MMSVVEWAIVGLRPAWLDGNRRDVGERCRSMGAIPKKLQKGDVSAE